MLTYDTWTSGQWKTFHILLSTKLMKLGKCKRTVIPFMSFDDAHKEGNLAELIY